MTVRPRALTLTALAEEFCDEVADSIRWCPRLDRWVLRADHGEAEWVPAEPPVERARSFLSAKLDAAWQAGTSELQDLDRLTTVRGVAALLDAAKGIDPLDI